MLFFPSQPLVGTGRFGGNGTALPEVIANSREDVVGWVAASGIESDMNGSMVDADASPGMADVFPVISEVDVVAGSPVTKALLDESPTSLAPYNVSSTSLGASRRKRYLRCKASFVPTSPPQNSRGALRQGVLH